ncbi:hypothetical protein LZ30DRAFT_460988 [Colletotrichum cereale]|nr:hypothetical protein LZ30DRAFT_460988 [Colletotrichum cereale]
MPSRPQTNRRTYTTSCRTAPVSTLRDHRLLDGASRVFSRKKHVGPLVPITVASVWLCRLLEKRLRTSPSRHVALPSTYGNGANAKQMALTAAMNGRRVTARTRARSGAINITIAYRQLLCAPGARYIRGADHFSSQLIIESIHAQWWWHSAQVPSSEEKNKR